MDEIFASRNVSVMDDPNALRAKAAHYRWLARQVADPKAKEAAQEIAAKLEERATLIEEIGSGSN
jgi:hypothetical protein